MFTFSVVVVVVDLPTDCILSFLFPAETDVLVPVFSQSTDVVVVNFVAVLKFPIFSAPGSIAHGSTRLSPRAWLLVGYHPYPTPPQTSNGRVDYHVVVFKTKVLHFKIENTTIKDTNGKRKECSVSFLWTNESFSL